MDHDIRSGTHKIYLSRFKSFSLYCVKAGYNPTDCPVEVVTNFLAMLKDTKHLSYQTICGYRSAISRYHKGFGSVPLGQAQLIKRVTKACFNLAPPIPKYSDMWNADQLMQHLQTMYPNSELSLKDLGIKAVALITVLSISRQSSVAALAPSFQVMNDSITIPLVKLEKTSRPNKLRKEVVLPAGNSYSPLSLANCLTEYLSRTEFLRVYHERAEGKRPEAMFISTLKPHQSVLPSTLAKWLLHAMEAAGIDTASFKANSVRSASASNMLVKGLSLAQVLKRGNWSDKTRTFSVYYDRSGRPV